MLSVVIAYELVRRYGSSPSSAGSAGELAEREPASRPTGAPA